MKQKVKSDVDLYTLQLRLLSLIFRFKKENISTEEIEEVSSNLTSFTKHSSNDYLVEHLYLVQNKLQQNPNDVTEEDILKIIDFEIIPGGPYKGKTNKDEEFVDFSLNAHILLLMTELEIEMPKLKAYLSRRLKDKDFRTNYYSTLWYGLFFCAKATKKFDKNDPLAKEVIKTIKVLKTNNSVEKLLQAITLLTLKIDPARDIVELIEMQSESSNITYEERLLKLELLLELKNTESQHVDQKEVLKDSDQLTGVIRREFQSYIKANDLEILNTLFPMNDRYKSFDFVSNIAADLKPDLNKKNIKSLNELGVYSHLIWLGIHLIDKLVDNEIPVEYMPIMVNVFRKFELETSNLEFVDSKILKSKVNICLEQYFFEATKMRFKSEDKKYNKIDHNYAWRRVEPFLYIISKIPSAIGIQDHKLEENIYEFFKSIMVIDQLNDDGHDWVEDEKNGILTFVVSGLFASSKDPSKHKDIFFEKVIFKIIDICNLEYKKIENILEKTDIDFFRKKAEASIGPIILAETELRKVSKITKRFSK